MEKVTLYTDNGKEVATVEIPHYNPAPQYIIWNERIYLLSQTTHKYNEAFGVMAFKTVN